MHNARNKALFGAWTLDAWNPMYIAPVFTGLEYAAFELFGVGVRQARLVSELTGFASVLLLAWGVGRLGGPRGRRSSPARCSATNYVYVMYDRAATMEASMVAFMVASWYCYVRAQAQPAMGAGRPRPARCWPSSPRHRRRSSWRRSACEAVDRAG